MFNSRHICTLEYPNLIIFIGPKNIVTTVNHHHCVEDDLAASFASFQLNLLHCDINSTIGEVLSSD